MKKRLLSALLCLALVLGLLPTVALAAPTRLKSVDLVIDLPKAGEPNEMETAVTIKSFKSGSIDLLAAGAGILYTEWMGDDVETDDAYLFRAGTTYLVNIKLAFDPSRGYCANYKTVGGENIVEGDTFSATVNGVRATIRTSAQYYPTLQVRLTIAGERLSESEKAELSQQQTANASALAAARRAMYPSVTRAQADARNLDLTAKNVVVMNGSDLGKGYDLGYSDDYADGYDLGYLDNFQNVRTLIMDIDDSAYDNNYCATEFPRTITAVNSLTEVWLSPKVDVAEFVARMDNGLRSYDQSLLYLRDSDLPFYTAKATLFIPESAVPALKSGIEGTYGKIKLVYTVKTYSGSDVYAAQKAGASAAKEWCTNHVYTAQIRSADRVYTYATCGATQLYYYSCRLCGKCEYNPKHVATDITDLAEERLYDQTHSDFFAELPNDSAYIGVNAAGQHIYWLSCDQCGKSYRYLQQHLTQKDVALTGTGLTLAQYQAEANREIQMRETLALSSTEVQPEMFALGARSTAKISAWAQSDVNLALNDDLLDTALLGTDYTKNISRLQFCSVAVRLAETLTGKAITPAPANTFTDTSNTYVLKAYAAGITTGATATTFAPNGTLTRQQMAAFLYRTLRYVEKNSDYTYTSYTSKLANYTDRAQLRAWAVEPMAFMNALDLIKGTTATTLSPNNTCTIQQAVAVAERSVYAHQIGWYQVVRDDDSASRLELLSAEGTTINTSLRSGDLVWATGRRMGIYNDETDQEFNLAYTFVPVINPYTGQTQYMFNRDLRPVRG